MKKLRKAIGGKGSSNSLTSATVENTEPICVRETVMNSKTEAPKQAALGTFAAAAAASDNETSTSSTAKRTDSSTNLIATPSAKVKNLPAVSPSVKKKKRVTDLSCNEVRWFVRKDGESKWTALSGYDSMVIEVAWRRKNAIPIDDATFELLDQIPKTDHVIVLEGLYMLDGDGEKLDSVYWRDESIALRRGSWFYADAMQPVSMDLAAAIEKHHLQSFKDQSIPEGPVFSETESSKRPVLTSLSWDEHDEVRWNSVIDVVYYNNSKASKFIRFVTRSKGTVLRRGFNEEAQLKDGKPNISELVLVVHGIGQKGYESLIAKNTGQIREAMQYILDKNYQGEQKRPMILPIEWRSMLVLDDGITDVITLPRMPGVRQAMNSSAMDIMYYQSPLYRSEIINGVTKSMNATYDLFVKNNPGFNGKVSILAHSLGSVITYDILTSWSPLLMYDEFVTKAIEEHIENTENVEERKLFESFHESRKRLFENEEKNMHTILLNRHEKLHFNVEHLFTIGSPLAVFLVMRGFDYTKVFPKDCRFKYLYNIFHPYDPVAYRLEPLYDSNYRNVRPVKLFPYNDERAKKPYANLPYELHKSYLRRLKKELKNKDKEAKGEKVDDKESDSDYDDDLMSTGSSPRSTSPVNFEDEVKDPPELPAPSHSSNHRSWWQFGGGGATVVPAVQEGIEEAKEAESGGSASSNPHSPVPPPIPPPPDVRKHPLTSVEGLVDQIKQERRLQNNLPGANKRIDYFIQPGVMDKSFISLLKSHFGYWQSYDMIAFITNVLYPQLATEEPIVAVK